MTRRTLVWLAVILMSAGALFSVAQRQWAQRYQIAKQHFIEEQSGIAHEHADKTNDAFQSLYDNLRTLASLPSVRGIDRHATNLSDEARVTFQQIYNTLATNVAVSEVYVVPIDLDPAKIDPVTGELEAPIIMFDHLIFNAGSGLSREQRYNNPDSASKASMAGPPEDESFEYSQFVDHAAWLKQHYSKQADIHGLEFPFISGKEVITCDNTEFINSKKDADRKGILFSVPFYSHQGELKGMVAAIVRSNALRNLLPSNNYALVNPANSFTNIGGNSETQNGSLRYIDAAKPDPSLFYSEAIPIKVQVAKGPWYIWASTPNADLAKEAEIVSNDQTYWNNISSIVILAIGIGTIVFLLERNLTQSERLNQSLSEANVASLKAEHESRDTADQLQKLNSQITNLNVELSQKISELRTAQDEIVRKGRMAQLGNLVATVAHEIRNPLGAVRTSAFRLKRQLAGRDNDYDKALAHIESGVARCDNIIAQLLDFSRGTDLTLERHEFDGWVEGIVSERSASLPDSIDIVCDLGTSGESVAFDAQQLHQVFNNLLSNAAEAMFDPRTHVPTISGRKATIKIATRQSKRGIEVEIVDNGPGIKPEFLSKIREPLFTTKSFGVGLGIPAVEKIVELHGGKLAIESKVGLGSTFSFWISSNLVALPEKKIS